MLSLRAFLNGCFVQGSPPTTWRRISFEKLTWKLGFFFYKIARLLRKFRYILVAFHVQFLLQSKQIYLFWKWVVYARTYEKKQCDGFRSTITPKNMAFTKIEALKNGDQETPLYSEWYPLLRAYLWSSGSIAIFAQTRVLNTRWLIKQIGNDLFKLPSLAMSCILGDFPALFVGVRACQRPGS